MQKLEAGTNFGEFLKVLSDAGLSRSKKVVVWGFNQLVNVLLFGHEGKTFESVVILVRILML